MDQDVSAPARTGAGGAGLPLAGAPGQPGERGFAAQLAACRDKVAVMCAAVPAPYPAFTLFFSVTDGQRRAHVLHATGACFDEAWQSGARRANAFVQRQQLQSPWLRVDWVQGVGELPVAEFEQQLRQVKRNYFRLGLAFDASFAMALTEQEINANALLYGGPDIAHAVINRHNLGLYLQQRYRGQAAPALEAQDKVYLLALGGVFCQEDGVVHRLAGHGLDTGRRQVPPLDAACALELVRTGSAHLARQVQDNGRFVYGYFPCFDRLIPSYNTLRHASSLYAMAEAWELTRDPALRQAIDRGLQHLTQQLVRDYTLADGRAAAFLVDVGDEIKLGGNAVALLALVKYSEVLGTDEWRPLMERLATGIAAMQDAATGRFVHVLHAQDLSVKEVSRIIYYDGEAAFGLLRLYALTRDERWLAVVERAFEHFIGQQHWQAHDHWLSYSVNELTRWKPLEKYFRFGIQNVAGYLDFVLDRKTTFPTLLELMLAAQAMIRRLEGIPALSHLLGEIDLEKFERALHYRANYLLNGYFWPEMAMYFRRPSAVVGSFFIRHHSFRVRIDDVEHYLSGMVAYHRLMAERETPGRAAPEAAARGIRWSAADLARITGGDWVVAPPEGWQAVGMATRPFAQPQRLLCLHDERAGRTPAPLELDGLRPAAAVLCAHPAPHLHRGLPVLRVDDVRQAMLELGAHARAQFPGRVVAVAGDAARDTAAAMLVQTLAAWGEVGVPDSRQRLPLGVAWSLTCLPQEAASWVVELGQTPAPAMVQVARPQVLVLAADPSESAVADGPRKTVQLIDAMPEGAAVVLCRDVAGYDALASAAARRGLRVIDHGSHRDAQVRLEALGHGELRADVGGDPVRARLQAVGAHVGLGATAVLATVVALGWQAQMGAALGALGGFERHEWRGPVLEVPIAGGSFHFVDETHDANPTSMRAALALLAQAPCAPRQRVAVLGEMQGLGAESQRHHLALQAEVLAAQPGRVLLCGPLMGPLAQRLKPVVPVRWFNDAAELVAAFGDIVAPGDWVLAKGGARIGLARLAKAVKAMV